MCANDFNEDDIGWGILLRKGEVSNAYLWRSGRVRGYAVVIYTQRHVAEPTELSVEEAAAFWRDTLALGRVLEQFYKPLKLTLRDLGGCLAVILLGVLITLLVSAAKVNATGPTHTSPPPSTWAPTFPVGTTSPSPLTSRRWAAR